MIRKLLWIGSGIATCLILVAVINTARTKEGRNTLGTVLACIVGVFVGIFLVFAMLKWLRFLFALFFAPLAALARAGTTRASAGGIWPDTEKGCVYFSQMGRQPIVKIGYVYDCASVGDRMKALQTANPHDFNLLATLNGPPDLERSMHDTFRFQRVGEREFFAYTGPLKQYIESLRRVDDHNEFPPQSNSNTEV
jgi:hypothetical protein